MTDKELVALLIATLRTGLAARGLGAVPVLQSYQPTLQGTEPDGKAIYLHRISSKRYGFLGRRTVDGAAGPGIVDHQETQYMERTFQVDALCEQDPADTTGDGAFDYLQACAAVLQSDAGRAALKVGGVGILRVTDIREPYMKDDRDQYEQTPSFDFTVTYKQTYMSEAPAISPPVQSEIHRV